MRGKLTVHFQQEEGIDAGGLTREWYQVRLRATAKQRLCILLAATASLYISLSIRVLKYTDPYQGLNIGHEHYISVYFAIKVLAIRSDYLAKLTSEDEHCDSVKGTTDLASQN